MDAGKHGLYSGGDWPVPSSVKRLTYFQRYPMATNERLTIDASNAFKILGISRNTGYSLIQRGEFPLPVIKAGKRLLIPKIAVERLLGVEGEQRND